MPYSSDLPARGYLPADTFQFAHGYAVVGKQGTTYEAGDVDRIFNLASVTKLLTAWSALIAVELQVIDLRATAGPDGSTLRHLLAHASGTPFEEGNILAKPGERRNYSNKGIEIVGAAITSRSGVSIEEWIAGQVLDPLGMTSTTVAGSPAYSGTSTVRDMEKFAAELLHPTLVSTQMANEATTVQYPGISGILPGYGRQERNDWGLGFEIRGSKQPHWTGTPSAPRTFGHFGQSGSYLWVDPEVRKAGIFLGAKPFDTEHARIWPALNDQMRQL